MKLNRLIFLFGLLIILFSCNKKDEEKKELASAEESTVFTTQNEIKNIQERAKSKLDEKIIEITGETNEEEVFQAAFTEEGYESVNLAMLTAGIDHFYYPLDFDLVEFVHLDDYSAYPDLSDDKINVLEKTAAFFKMAESETFSSAGIVPGRENILKNHFETISSLSENIDSIRLGLPEQDRNRMTLSFKLLEDRKWAEGFLYFLFENDLWLIEAIDINPAASEEKKEEGLFNPSSLL